MTLKFLKEKMLKVASSDTAYDPQTYKGGMHGHCFAAALVVQQYFGGDIVSGKVNGERHGWNKLPNGNLVDLTSCQFGGDGFSPLSDKYVIFQPKTINKRFKLFLDRVNSVY